MRLLIEQNARREMLNNDDDNIISILVLAVFLLCIHYNIPRLYSLCL